MHQQHIFSYSLRHNQHFCHIFAFFYNVSADVKSTDYIISLLQCHTMWFKVIGHIPFCNCLCNPFPSEIFTSILVCIVLMCISSLTLWSSFSICESKYTRASHYSNIFIIFIPAADSRIGKQKRLPFTILRAINLFHVLYACYFTKLSISFSYAIGSLWTKSFKIWQ